jgi:hypothetical protein
MDMQKLKSRLLTSVGVGAGMLAGAIGVSATDTIWSTLNETLDSVVGLLPKIGDLLNGVGTNLIWPVVYILVILGIAGVILGVFGMVVGIVAAVLLSVTKFAHNIGNKRK